MTDLLFSKQVKERQKFFPWLKIFQRKLLKNFANDVDFDTLQFLLLNVKEEVTTLPKSGKTERKKALFEVIYDLFLHFWWRIHWKGKKKWSRRWKNISSDISYTKDEPSKCSEELLYYIIHLGITLSKDSSDSEWVGKVLQAIHILPNFDLMIYSSLLQVNIKKLSYKYRPAYNAILKHVLCTKVVVNITEPAVYIKIIILFKRLKKFTKGELAISDLESIASRYKPSSDIIQWMSSQVIDIPLEQLESISKEPLCQISSDLFNRLYQVVTTSEKKVHTQLCQNEEIKPLNNKTKVKKCKHKGKSHSKLKLQDSQLNISVNRTSVCLNPLAHSEVNMNFNYKTQTTITKNSTKYKNLNKKTCSKNQKLLNKKLSTSTGMIKATAMNEFLNFSFAEISNFSKRVVSLNQNPQYVSESNCGIESNTLKKGIMLNESIAVKNVTSNSTEEWEQAKSCNGPSSHKKIKLDSNEKISKKDQSIQTIDLQESGNTPCLNSSVALSANELKSFPLNTSEILTNGCTNKIDNVSDQEASVYQNIIPCFSNNNLFDAKTSANQKRSSQMQAKQTSPDKIQFVSSVDIQNIYPSVLLKLVQLPNEDSTSRHCETSTNVLCESINSNQIDANADNPSVAIPASGSSSIIQTPHSLKVLCDVPPNISPENINTTQIDTGTDKATGPTTSISDMHLSKNVDENICRNSEINFKHPSSENSSFDLRNSSNHCTSWMENKSNSSSSFLKGLFEDHRWGESQPLIPTINRSLEPTQNCLVNHTKTSIENSEVTYVNSFVTHRTENELGNVTVSQSDTSPKCVVDCKIVNDYEPNKMPHESISSFKVVINVSCKIPEDAPNQQSEHTFGNFNHASQNYFGSSKALENIPNQPSENIFGNFKHASKNYFDSSQNLFSTPTPHMPKLMPFYDDPPISAAAVDIIATPPDSELEISIPTSFSKQSEAGTPTNTFFENPQNKPNYSSTPKDAPNKLPRRISKEDSDFRTPQTSDCESSSEGNEETVDLTKSPVDDILERLNYKICLPQNKSESHKATAAQNVSKENLSYRSFTDAYSYDELSEDSTISTVSRISKTDESNLKTIGTNKQGTLNVLKNRRKNANPKKYSEGEQNIPEKSSRNVTCGYNLRPRKKLIRPPSLEEYLI